MNYNSVADIIAAGVTNATVIRNNSRNDDGTDTLAGVSWFTFNNVIANNIYVSGNTWFGIGANAEQLRVDRRDAASYYVYREEGTLYNEIRFLKIRWSGYTYYNTTSASYKMTYDVIFWETGDISLHMVDVPTSEYNGTFSLTEGNAVYNYTKPTAQAPDVTFKKKNGVFTVYYTLISLVKKRYLIRAGGVLYDVTGEELATQTLTAQTFLDYGNEEPPDDSVLLTFTNPQVLFWKDSTDELAIIKATENATPPPQVMISGDYDLTDATILGIEDADVVASSDVLFAISFDSGTTWKAYDGTAWQTLSSNDSGMDATTFNSIGVSAWAAAVGAATAFKIRAYLPANTSYITSLIINFLN